MHEQTYENSNVFNIITVFMYQNKYDLQKTMLYSNLWNDQYKDSGN